MKQEWKEIPHGDKRAQWAGIYATLNNKGTVVLNRAADERMGSPAAYQLLYDSANNTIGLKPTALSLRNAYPAQKSGRHGGRKVNAYRLLTECSLLIKETLEFPDAEIRGRHFDPKSPNRQNFQSSSKTSETTRKHV